MPTIAYANSTPIILRYALRLRSYHPRTMTVTATDVDHDSRRPIIVLGRMVLYPRLPSLANGTRDANNIGALLAQTVTAGGNSPSPILSPLSLSLSE